MYSSNFVAVDPTASHKQNSSLQRCLDNRYTMSQGRSHSVWSTLASNARVDHIECNEKSVMSLATPTPATRSSGFAQQHHDTQHPLPLAPPRVPISTRAIQRAISPISSPLCWRSMSHSVRHQRYKTPAALRSLNSTFRRQFQTGPLLALTSPPRGQLGSKVPMHIPSVRYHVTQEPTVPTLCARSASDRKNAMGIEVRSPNRTPECEYPWYWNTASWRTEGTKRAILIELLRVRHVILIGYLTLWSILSLRPTAAIAICSVFKVTSSSVYTTPNVWSTTPTSIESPIEILDLLSTFRHRLWPKFLLKDIDQEGDHTRSHFGVSLAEAFLERAMVPWSAVLGALPQILYSF
ncbi:hypothetical protein BKA70DRAFT_1237047 [Coprinopsis sp. MPI-PUGE-AT-0042]|nr:hypothetical protein BKA70DRAFT_1237047 [Coprinopsis sp. MPI-PUGE-AT-0042]